MDELGTWARAEVGKGSGWAGRYWGGSDAWSIGVVEVYLFLLRRELLLEFFSLDVI